MIYNPSRHEAEVTMLRSPRRHDDAKPSAEEGGSRPPAVVPRLFSWQRSMLLRS